MATTSNSASKGAVGVPLGARFGRWTVTGEFVASKDYLRVPCRCDCGTERLVIVYSLVHPAGSRSCGCTREEYMASRRIIIRPDGSSKHPLAQTWRGMMHRCHNPNSPGYRFYGARGITVCQRWRESFVAFCEDMGERPSASHSVDRIDTYGGYSPDNCRWATAKQQGRNSKSNRLLIAMGETLCLAEWSERSGRPVNVITKRLSTGMTAEEAIFGPIQNSP